MSLACTQLGMTPGRGARRLHGQRRLGAGAGRPAGPRSRPGYDGDLVLLDADDWRHVSYHLGGRVAAAVFKRGRAPVNDLPRRIAALATVEAVGLIGVAMTLVGVAVTVDALVEASRATPGASLLPWYDRLPLGLWELRLEHTVWFTAGLVVLWWALAHGATAGRAPPDAARAAGGLAVGFALVAAVMALGLDDRRGARRDRGRSRYPASSGC